VIDVSNPANPKIIGSEYMPVPAYDVTVVDSIAYVADGTFGVQIIDVSSPSKPRIIASLNNGSISARALTVANNNLYFSNEKSLEIVSPLSDFIDEFPVQVNSKSKLTIPDFQRNLPGNYNLHISNGPGKHEDLLGAITVTDNAELFNAKAIIVAGGGADNDDIMWQRTREYANLAYATLRYQGYTDNQIYYLTDQTDAPGRDGPADKAMLQKAINWAKTGPTSSLIVNLVDHGDQEQFMIRGGTSAQYVSADELDIMLDGVQQETGAKVLFVYDACRSGSFAAKMTPPEDMTRIHITSASFDQSANFLSDKGSFSSHFWSVFSGKAGERVDIPSAWQRASSTMAGYQTAQLDANGNGITNEPGELKALKEISFPFGRSWRDDTKRRPTIASVSRYQKLDNTTRAWLQVNGPQDSDGDVIVRVWAEILRPDMEIATGETTVLSAIEVDLIETSTGVYKARYDNFNARGTYIISYYVMDEDGLVSIPKTSLITQPRGTLLSTLDQYEGPNTPGGRNRVITVNAPVEHHTFHYRGDNDWCTFSGIQGKNYEIMVSNLSPLSDPIIELYGPDSSALLIASANRYGNGWQEVLEWKCPTSGDYYIRITNGSNYFGNNVYYDLSVTIPEAFSLPGRVYGRIQSASGAGISGAVLSTGKGSGRSLGNGSYVMMLPAGSHTVTVSKAGYQSRSFGVNVRGGGSAGRTVTLSKPNSAPTISGSPTTSLRTNELFHFKPTVSDPGDTFSFSIDGQPSWAQFSRSLGTLEGIPNAEAIGTYGPITITVTDSGGLRASLAPFTLNVALGENKSPFISGKPPAKIRATRLFSFIPSASDANGDAMTFSVLGQPAWTQFDTGRGRLYGTPGLSNIGVHGPVTLKATDTHGAFSTLKFTLNVVPDAEVDALGVLPAVYGVLLQGGEEGESHP
jgi:hypothetical protein